MVRAFATAHWAGKLISRCDCFIAKVRGRCVTGFAVRAGSKRDNCWLPCANIMARGVVMRLTGIAADRAVDPPTRSVMMGVVVYPQMLLCRINVWFWCPSCCCLVASAQVSVMALATPVLTVRSVSEPSNGTTAHDVCRRAGSCWRPVPPPVRRTVLATARAIPATPIALVLRARPSAHSGPSIAVRWRPFWALRSSTTRARPLPRSTFVRR